MTDSAPYIGIKSREFGLSKEDVLSCFPPELGFVAKEPEEIPLESYAGPGPIDATTVNQLANWLVNVGPEHLIKISLWALAGYAGKEFVKGFVGELSKDSYKSAKKLGRAAWGGILKLAKKIRKAKSNANPRLREEFTFINFGTDGYKENNEKLNVVISFHAWKDDQEFEKARVAIETVFLPLAALYTLDSQPVHLTIGQGTSTSWGEKETTIAKKSWTVWDMHHHELVTLNLLNDKDGNLIAIELDSDEGDFRVEEHLKELGFKIKKHSNRKQ